MKKRIICIAVAAALLFSVPMAAKADSSGVYFTAVCDSLLDLGSMPVFVGGSVYVPCRVFSAFGIYFNYFDTASTALLYNASRQIFFNLTDGGSYDSAGNVYSSGAVLRNGAVYVPVAWVCSYFGISYSYIGGNGNGDIVRIKNGSEVLTDSQFLDAATSLMKTRYNEYYGMVEPVSPTQPSPTPGEEEKSVGAYVFLSFIGAPDKLLLDTLDNYRYKASFFLTAQQARDNPDILRRMYGSGHNVGIYVAQDAPAECSDAQDAMFSMAQFRPGFICAAPAATEAAADYASENGYCLYEPQVLAAADTRYATDVTAKLADATGYVRLCIELGENTRSLLTSVFRYFGAENFSVIPMRETYF